MKSIGARQQLLDLGGGQPLAVERDLHLEIEQRVGAKTGRRLAANRRAHLRTRRTIRAPRARHAHDDAGGFQRGGDRSRVERLPPASSAAGDRSRPHRPSLSATRIVPPRAGPAGAATGAAPCWPRPRTRAEPGRGAGAGPSRARTAASCTSPGTQTARPRSFLFSARLKWTRPTRCQAALLRSRKS